MFVDASALVAMMTDEDDAKVLASRIGKTSRRITSPIAVFEATAAIARILALPVERAAAEVETFLKLMAIETVDVPVAAGPIAIDAFARYGKGQRHPAQLNMGDCFAYACARHYRLPLLFKGTDFAETDIEAA